VDLDQIPNFITPTSLDAISDEKLRPWLFALRERRLAAARAYEASRIRASQETSVKLQKQVAKQLELFKKDLARCDKLLDKIDARLNKLAAQKLELEQVGA